MTQVGRRRCFTFGASIVVRLLVGGEARSAPVAEGVASTVAPTEVPSAPASDAATAAALELLFHADIDGRFDPLNCGKTPRTPAPATFAGLVGTIGKVRHDAALIGRAPPLVLLGGNFATPDLPGALMVAGPREGARRLADLLGQAGYDAIAIGHRELSLEPDTREVLPGRLATIARTHERGTKFAGQTHRSMLNWNERDHLAGGRPMLQRNDAAVSNASKNSRRRPSTNATPRRPDLETPRYSDSTHLPVSLTRPPSSKRTYSIGELVSVAFDRASQATRDRRVEALIATRLLAEWLVNSSFSASMLSPAAASSANGQRHARSSNSEDARAEFPSAAVA